MASSDPKPIKSELHHWWPRTLSKHWRDDSGKCHRLSWDGRITRSNPSNFGAITNAHHIKHGNEPTVWDGSIEGQFGSADGQLSALIERLVKLDSIVDVASSAFEHRLLPQLVPDRLVQALCECALSLVLRSPRFRTSIRNHTLDLQERMGMQSPSANDTLVSLNVNGRLKLFAQQIQRRGKWVVMYSDGREFIHGDGFLHNYSSASVAPLHPRMLLSLTPTIAIFFVAPLRYPSRPRLLTLRLTKDEAAFINEVTLAYSRDCIFYRSEKPTDLSLLERHEYLGFQYDKHPWIEALIDSAMTFHDPERREKEAALDGGKL